MTRLSHAKIFAVLSVLGGTAACTTAPIEQAPSARAEPQSTGSSAATGTHPQAPREPSASPPVEAQASAAEAPSATAGPTPRPAGAKEKPAAASVSATPVAPATATASSKSGSEMKCGEGVCG